MLLVVGAGKGSPGATATATALALVWPRPVLLVDADPAGGDVAPGLLPGRVTADVGLLTWAAATRRESAMTSVGMLPEHVVALPEAPGVWVMPGLQSPTQVGAVTTAWGRIAQSLERVPSVLDRDVIVDAGRLGEASSWGVVEAADELLVAVRPTMRSVCGTKNALALVTRKIGDTAGTRLLVVGDGPYTSGQISDVTGVDVTGEIPTDRRAAAALTDGAVVGIGGLRRSKLMRRARLLADSLIELHSASPGAGRQTGSGVAGQDAVSEVGA